MANGMVPGRPRAIRAIAHTRTMKRLPRILWPMTPTGRTAAEGAPLTLTEVTEDVGFTEAEPGRTRFARLETEGFSETEIGPGASL